MLDLRLAIPAVVAWAVVGIAIGIPAALPLLVSITWGVTGAAILIAVLRHGGGPVVAIAVSTAAVALVLTSAMVKVPAREPALLLESLGSGRAVELVVRTTESVAESGAASGAGSGTAAARPGSTVSFAVRIDRATVAGRAATMDVPARVFADAVDRDIPIGSSVSVRGSLSRTGPGDSLAFLVFAEGSPEVVSEAPALLLAADELRAGLRARAAGLPGDGAGLLPGLAVGDTGGVSMSLDSAMKASSLSHLTAVSGANCAVVVGLVMLVGGLVGLRRIWRITIAVVVLAGFVVLVTPEPSVLRAAVMAVIVLGWLSRGRPTRGVAVLSVTVIALIVIDPWLSREFGFVLSVLATGGLLLLAGPLTRSLSRIMPVPLAAVVAVPLAAQLACQPVIVLLSPTLPTYGVLANILAAPAAPVGTVLGLLACVLGPLAPWMADLLVRLAWVPAAWIAAVARVFEAAPGARLPWLGDAPGVVLTTVVTAAVVMVLVGRSGLLRWTAVGVVAITAIAYAGMSAGTAVRVALTRPEGWIYGACDVGQGDASVVRSAGRIAMIDAGPDPDRLTGCLDSLGIGRIDLLVLTHFDLDHVGGAAAVVGRVDRVLVGPVDGPEAERLVQRLQRGGAQVDVVSRGVRGRLGTLDWTVVWPTDPLRGVEPGNDASVAMVFDGSGGCAPSCPSALFLGDLGESAQARMIAPTAIGRVDVVKVSHHGSADQSPGLYSRISASVALIGVGAGNDYGHPTTSALDMLAGTGTSVTRTDRDGLVLIAPTDAGGLEIWRERGG